MKTVKEVSKLTGISVRTLYYYDEIGLFKPTEVKETGYRLYDDTLLIRFSQIIVLRTRQFPLTADMMPGIWNLTWKEKTWLRLNPEAFSL